MSRLEKLGFQGWQRSLFYLLCVLGVLVPCLAWGQASPSQDYGQISHVPREELDSWLKAEVKKRGGDWENQRYHFLVGFSTGHFGQDPVHAIAMRRLAFSLLNNAFAPGDRVTPIAWEMSLWDTGKTVTLTDAQDTRAEVVNRVPYTAQQGSAGGHDVERSLYEILTQAVPAESTKSSIILLFTNGPSQSPTGQRANLFGANNPQLVEAIQKGGFHAPPVRHSFTLQAKDRPRSVEVVALFPEQLESLPGAPATSRYPTFARETWTPEGDMPEKDEKLPNAVRSANTAPNPAPIVTKTVTTEEHKEGGTPLWLYGLIALVVIGLIVWGVMRAQANPKPPVSAAKQEKAVPLGKPLPGAIEVVVGPKPQTLQPLTTLSKWVLTRTEAGLLISEEEKAEGTLLAKLVLDEQKRLAVQAEAETQFTQIQGSNLKDSNNRLLLLAPGERLFCRVQTADVSTPARLELIYHKERKP